MLWVSTLSVFLGLTISSQVWARPQVGNEHVGHTPTSAASSSILFMPILPWLTTLRRKRFAKMPGRGDYHARKRASF
jgi:hypothetical protein